MILFLTSGSPWNSNYTTAEGQVIYSVDAPFKVRNRIATIRRVLPNTSIWDEGIKTIIDSDIDRRHSHEEEKEDDKLRKSMDSDDGEFIDRSPSPTDPSANKIFDDDTKFRDQFANIAQIVFRNFHSTSIRYDGKELDINTLFRKEGWSWYGRNRVFIGPDGKEYAWKLGIRVPELILNDGSKTCVACYHRRRLGFFSKARPASLEILPAGEHMADLILVTFVYIEKMRKTRENASKSHGGGGP